MTRRPAALAALVVVVATGLVVHAVGPPGVPTDIAGDALYAVAAYAGLVLLFPRAARATVGALAGVWCVGVELLQLTGVPVALAQRLPPVALVLGSGFDARDLVVYLTAVMAALGLDRAVAAQAERRRAGRDTGTRASAS